MPRGKMKAKPSKPLGRPRVPAASKKSVSITIKERLLEACKATLPHLHWANCHGDRCDEVIAAVQAAIAEAEPDLD